MFREIRTRLDTGHDAPGPTAQERIDLCKKHLIANTAQRGEPYGVRVTRRHLSGYLRGLRGAALLRRTLLAEDSLEACLRLLDATEPVYAGRNVLDGGELSL